MGPEEISRWLSEFEPKQNQTAMAFAKNYIPSTKKHELFIPIPENYVINNQFDFAGFAAKETSFLIPSEVVERFHDLADQRTNSQKDMQHPEEWFPYHPKGMQRALNNQLRIQDGDLVFFRPNEKQNHLVEEIALSSIWRGRVECDAQKPATVSSFFPKELLPFNQQRTHLSPAELLFGFTELNPKDSQTDRDALAFAGKVRISAGNLRKNDSGSPEPLEPEITLKALSSPKPPSPALYFTQKGKKDSTPFITKQTLSPAHHIAKGRKYYLHAWREKADGRVKKFNDQGLDCTNKKAKFPWQTHDENERQQLKVKIKPISTGTSFYFHLDFDNLTKWELGLLCYALRPNAGFRHRIGMGKPIGLGSVKIELMALQTLDRCKRYLEDSLNDQRFNACNWTMPNEEKELETAGYPVFPASGALEPEALTKAFTDTMDADIYRALELLGEPGNITRPVHYPQVENQQIEQENYKWFIANDHGSGERSNKIEAAEQMLASLDANSTQLPTLTRHKWKGK